MNAISLHSLSRWCNYNIPGRHSHYRPVRAGVEEILVYRDTVIHLMQKFDFVRDQEKSLMIPA